MSNYGEDDFIACLAFAGTPPHLPSRATTLSGHEVKARLRYHDDVETFCINWFEGKPIDGQWAGFLTAFLNWQQQLGRIRR